MKKGIVSSMLVWGVIAVVVILVALMLPREAITQYTNDAIKIGEQVAKPNFEESLESLREKCLVHEAMLSDDLAGLGLSVYTHTTQQMNDLVTQKAKECIENMANLRAYSLHDPTPAEIDKVNEAMDEINADHHYVKGLFYYQRYDRNKAIEEFQKAAKNPSTYMSVQKAKEMIALVQNLPSCPAEYTTKKDCEENICKTFLACNEKGICDSTMAKQQLFFDETTQVCSEYCKIKEDAYKSAKCCQTTKETTAGTENLFFIDISCTKSVINLHFQGNLEGAKETDVKNCCTSSTVSLADVSSELFWTVLYNCPLHKSLVSSQITDAGITPQMSIEEVKSHVANVFNECNKDIVSLKDMLISSPIIPQNKKNTLQKTADGLQKELVAEKLFVLGLFFYQTSDYKNAILSLKAASEIEYSIPFGKNSISAVSKAKDVLVLIPNTNGCLSLGNGKTCCKATFDTETQYFVDTNCETGKGKVLLQKLYNQNVISVHEEDVSFCCTFHPEN